MYDIYHWEAHPSSQYPEPKTLEKRIQHYEAYVQKYSTSVPGLVDDGNCSVSRQKWSARWTTIFLVGLDGKIVIRDDFTGTWPESNWVEKAYPKLDKKIGELLPNDTDPPNVTVTEPTSGEFVQIGNSYSIKWDATDISGIKSRAIYYTSDGSSWTKIDSADGNTGSFVWTVPNVTSEDCKIRVNAYDPFGNKGTGESDDFQIGATGIVIDFNGTLPNTVSCVHTNGLVFLTVPDQINYALDIFNSTGRCVISENGYNAVTYNLSNMLTSGHYVIKVTSQNKNYMRPIVINK